MINRKLNSGSKKSTQLEGIAFGEIASSVPAKAGIPYINADNHANAVETHCNASLQNNAPRKSIEAPFRVNVSNFNFLFIIVFILQNIKTFYLPNS